MNSWKTYKLGEIAEIIMGQSPSGETCNEKELGIPLLNGPTEFNTHFPIPVQYTTDPKKLSEIDDILFCVRGSTTGKMNWSDRRYAIGRGLAAIRHKHGKEYKHFLKGVIDSNLKNILGITTGSTFPNIGGEQLKEFEVIAPDLPTQKEIASILSSLDDKIELNLQMNQTLEAMAQAIFKEWFINFNFPGFDGNLVNGLPKGWRRMNLSELVETISKTHKFPKGNAIFLNTSDILEGEFLHNRYSDFESLPGQAKKTIQYGDILFSEIRPANKRYAFVDFDAIDYVVSTKLMVLRSKGLVDNLITYFFMKSNEVLNQLQLLAESRSGTFPQITYTELSKIEINIPDSKILNLYTDFLSSTFKKIRENQQQNQTLTQLRENLLPKLMSGKISIK